MICKTMHCFSKLKVIFIEICVAFHSGFCAQNLVMPFVIFTKKCFGGSLHEVLSGLVYKVSANKHCVHGQSLVGFSLDIF